MIFCRIRVAARRERRAATPARLIAAVMAAAVTLAGTAACTSRPPQGSVGQLDAAAAVTPADLLFDLMQPAEPMPAFIDPRSSADPAGIAIALEIEHAAGTMVAPDPVNTAALGAYLDDLPAGAPTTSEILVVLDTLTVNAEDSYNLLTPGRQRGVAAALAESPSDGGSAAKLLDVIEDAAHVRQLIAAGTPERPVGLALGGFISREIAAHCALLHAAASNQVATLGLLLDAAHADPGQRCINAPAIKTAYLRAAGADAAPSPDDIAVMAELQVTGVGPGNRAAPLVRTICDCRVSANRVRTGR